MHIILFFLFFLLAIVVFGLSVIGFILRAIFGIGKGSSKTKQTYNRKNGQQRNDNYNQQTKSYDDDDDFYSDASGHNRKKIFSKDEGEYVDYEEIK